MKRFKMTGRRRFFLFCIAAAVIFSLPVPANNLVNMETGKITEDVELIYPLASQFFAPFLDFPFYFLTLPNPKMQLLSWISWLLIFWLVLALMRLKGSAPKKLLLFFRGLLVTAVSFVLFISYCILCPIPQRTLKSKKTDEIFLDLHSHTIYSHDGLATPKRSLQWHLDSGFKAWALTEHDLVGPASLMQNELIDKTSSVALSITAQEVNFHRGHLNLIGIKNNFETKKHKDLKGLVEAARLQNGAVIVPHYWAATKSPFSMEDFFEAGADGFEVAGNASVPLSSEMRNKIISFCKDKGMVMVSGTNWHGWRNFCTVWTGFKTPSWAHLDRDGRERQIIDALRKRETSRFRVIGYAQNLNSKERYFFEPFTGLFSYFLYLTRWQRISWLFWSAIAVLFLTRKKNKRRLAVLCWVFIGFILLVKRISVLETWTAVSGTNEILPEVAQSLLVLAFTAFFLAATGIKKRVKKKVKLR